MTLVNLEADRWMIHSAVAVDDLTLEQIRALGRMVAIVVPSSLHRFDAAWYKLRFPEAKVLCPEPVRAKVEELVPVDGTVESELPKLGARVHEIPGVKPIERAIEIESGRGPALLICDVLFNLPHQPGIKGRLLRWMGSSGFFGMTRLGRFMLLKDREAFRAWLQQQSERTDLHSVIPAHGDPVVLNLNERLKQAAQLLGA
jgi:hypothetical protein